jgi:hypothetical protein
MAISTSQSTHPEVTDSYARLEEKVLERDQRGASQIYYDLVRTLTCRTISASTTASSAS